MNQTSIPVLFVGETPRISTAAAQKCVMELYPRARCTASDAARLLEVPTDHPAVKVALSVTAEAAMLQTFGGFVAFVDVEAFARKIVEAR